MIQFDDQLIYEPPDWWPSIPIDSNRWCKIYPCKSTSYPFITIFSSQCCKNPSISTQCLKWSTPEEDHKTEQARDFNKVVISKQWLRYPLNSWDCQKIMEMLFTGLPQSNTLCGGEAAKTQLLPSFEYFDDEKIWLESHWAKHLINCAILINVIFTFVDVCLSLVSYVFF